MSIITYFSPPPPATDLPKSFLTPLNSAPHALAKKASEQLQMMLRNPPQRMQEFNPSIAGKMFGVLVVQDNTNKVGFIAAFSGKLAEQWLVPGFVPPIFDIDACKLLISAAQAEFVSYSQQLKKLQQNGELYALRQQLTQLKIAQEIDLASLHTKHSHRKEVRQQKRRTPSSSLTHSNAHSSLETTLASLSFESQQDKRERQTTRSHWKARLAVVQQKLDHIEQQIEGIKNSRTARLQTLQQRILSTYTLSNILDERRAITKFFDQPPPGVGDCAAIKLLHFATLHKLKPLALSQFWWGDSPAREIRQHAQFYPVCRGKCWPILPFMLRGIKVRHLSAPGSNYADNNAPDIIYEDDDLLVVNKPHGLLSVPGKTVQDSVLSRLRQRYPKATGPILVHRLDLFTSGLLLAAKNSATHKTLQQQFLQRSIKKRYIAVLAKELSEKFVTDAAYKERIELPICSDVNDRPRQMVCFDHGKTAITDWELISCENGTSRVYFYPITGRTHQLRVHAAHKMGLNTPIVGDKLYGQKMAERLLLHAEKLCFTHPRTNKTIEVCSPAPF